MTKVIGVRFKSSGRIYYFDPAEFEVQVGDGVIVETARGQEFGDVAQGVTEIEDTMIVAPLKPVLRLASERDKSMREQNSGKEDDAFSVCQKKIAERGLDMKLVDAEYSFNGSKLVFYFTADERVDFRELVKDLASHFKTRIELRQIGVRDEAKMLGGLGSCGRPVCCKTFLDDFRPVSIKMAKEQNLSLSPTKISGLCGRLMCCLQYEQAGYEEMKKKMPRVNRDVLTPDGVGYAIENNAITERTRVRLALPDGSIDVREYHYTLLGVPGEPLSESVLAARREQEQRAQAVPGDELAPAQRQQPIPAQSMENGGGFSGNGGARRGRRGGKPMGERGAEAAAKPQPAAGTGAQPQRQGGSGTQQQQQRRGGGAQQPRQGGQARPQGVAQGARQPSAAQAEQQPGEQQNKPNGNRRRRRRGGGRGPRPEGGAAPAQKPE